MSMHSLDPKHVETLRHSYELVGPLQNVVVNKVNGKVLLGNHRLAGVPEWPKIEIPVRDDGLHEDLIILSGNTQREVKEEEVKHRMLRIANTLFLRYKVPKEEVCSKMTELLKGMYSGPRIRQLLPKEFKMESKVRVCDNVSANISAKSPLSGELDRKAKEVKSSLEVGFTVTGDTYSYLDCKCRECNHKVDCGHPPDK